MASGSDWRFFRCDVYQSPSNQSCGAPIYEHVPLSSPATDDFYAILYGDVSGSWAPLENRIAPLTAGGASDDEAAAIARDRETARRLRARPSDAAPLPTQGRPARLTLEGAQGAMRAGETRTVRLGIQDADGIEALDLDLDYDPAKLEIAAVEPDGLAAAWSLARNETAGSLRMALYGPLAVKGSGPILTLRVTARAALPSGTGLRVGGVANEGEIPLLPPTRGPS